MPRVTSLYFLYTREPLGESVCEENTSDKWHIPRYPMRKHCITNLSHSLKIQLNNIPPHVKRRYKTAVCADVLSPGESTHQFLFYARNSQDVDRQLWGHFGNIRT